MRQLRHTIGALLHTITVVEADEGIGPEERDFMLDMLYRDLASARSALRALMRAA